MCRLKYIIVICLVAAILQFVMDSRDVLYIFFMVISLALGNSTLYPPQRSKVERNALYQTEIKHIKTVNCVHNSWYVVYNQLKMKWPLSFISWWRHKMETFSALLAFCMGNSLVTGEFPAQRRVTWSFDVFFFLSAPESTVEQTMETLLIWGATVLPRSLWRHSNALKYYDNKFMQ